MKKKRTPELVVKEIRKRTMRKFNAEEMQEYLLDNKIKHMKECSLSSYDTEED